MKINKSIVSKTLSSCKFDPKEPGMAMMIDIDSQEYYLHRSRELLCETVNMTDHKAQSAEIRKAIQVLTIALINSEQVGVV